MKKHPAHPWFQAAQGVRGLLVSCAQCTHSVATRADQWPDDARLSDLEPHFVCQVCDHRGADVRPDFDWDRQAAAITGAREGRSREFTTHYVLLTRLELGLRPPI
jgi:hypothetical protein